MKTTPTIASFVLAISFHFQLLSRAPIAAQQLMARAGLQGMEPAHSGISRLVIAVRRSIGTRREPSQRSGAEACERRTTILLHSGSDLRPLSST